MKKIYAIAMIMGLVTATAVWGGDHHSSRKKGVHASWLHYKKKNRDGKHKDRKDKYVTRNAAAAIIETEPENWYVRLTAEAPARGLSTENTQIGQLDKSDAAAENLAALNPFGGGYIDIVILEADAAQELKGSFHPTAAGEADSWRFMLKTDDPNSNIILSWRGLYVLTPYRDEAGRQRYKQQLSKTNPLLSKMQIVDEGSGEVVPVLNADDKSYVLFNMEGSKTRIFRWELLPFESEATEGSSEITVKYARKFFKRFESAAHKTFDLGKPPKRDRRPGKGPKPFKGKE